MIVDLARPYAGFAEALDTAVRALDVLDRESFIAIHLRGLPMWEAEAILGRSRPVLDKRAERARLNLKKELT